MKIIDHRDVKPSQEAPGVFMRTVIGATDGAPRFAMRVFEVEPGSSTPLHTHWWEHEVYILSGSGYVTSKDGDTALKPGDVVYVEPNELHCFTNKGDEPFRFVCVIPIVEAV